jgi:hypothetical protein
MLISAIPDRFTDSITYQYLTSALAPPISCFFPVALPGGLLHLTQANLETCWSVSVSARSAVGKRCARPALYVSVGKVSRKKRLQENALGVEILLVGKCRLHYTRQAEK